MEGVTLSQCCPMGVCSRSECGLLPSLRRCVYSCSISYHTSIGARGGEHEGRLRLDEEVLDAPEELRQPVFGVGGAQEDQGQERLVFCSSLRGRWRIWRRNGRRAGSGEAHSVNFSNLARQSHRQPIVAFFNLSIKGMWQVACSRDVLG